MQREQDYLVSQPGGQQNEDTQRSYRLAGGPSFGVSSSGGQVRPASNFQAAQQASPDRARQTFRTRERQIREVRPVDFTLRDTAQTKSDIGADIVSQGIQQEQRLAESGPKVEEFLPDYEKALTGDQDAIMRTGYRLQNPYEERKVEDIRPTAGQTFLDFLRAPGQDTYHTELAKQQGGPFGVNALDAARLAASGQGARAFSRAAQDIGSVYNLIPEAEARVAESETRRANQYAETVDSIRALLQGGEQQYKTEAQRKIDEYKNRNVDPELRAIVEELKVTNPELGPYLGMDFGQLAPFIDRELTFAETLSPEEADRYNIIAELLGVNPVQRLAPEAGFNRESIIAALLAEAQNEQQAAILAEKQESERRARQAAGASQQAEDDRRERDLNRSTNITGGGQPVSRDTGVVDVSNW